MSKTWDTKRKIFGLLSKRNMTLTEVSDSLNLSPSTVSKHFEELRRMGAISQIENEHTKKWKYYRATDGFDFDKLLRGERMVSMTQKVAIVIGVVFVIGLFYLFASQNQMGIQSSGTVPLRLTDPPQVPQGTQALVISYSSVNAHVIGSGQGTGWVNASGSGTVDLMTLINASQVIGTSSVAANQSINEISFMITSANIVINGTSYPVTVPNNQITAQVNGTANASSSVLIDFSPVVVSIFTQNSTDFVLVPSVKAVAAPVAGIYINLGFRSELSAQDREALEHSRANITISSANLNVSNNSTDFVVVIKNNGNRSTVINHVLLKGPESVTIMPFANLSERAEMGISDNLNIGDQGNLQIRSRAQVPMVTILGGLYGSSSVNASSYNGSASASFGMNSSARENAENSNGSVDSQQETAGQFSLLSHSGIGVNLGDHIGQGISILNGNLSVDSDDDSFFNSLLSVAIQARTFRTINFVVNTNGSLGLPFSEQEFDGGQMGYSLQPGASVMLTFSGKITVGNGRITISPANDSSYNVIVIGRDGATANTSVTTK